MVLIFYVYGFLLFSPYKDKLDDMYASLWVYFNIEDDRDLNKYLGIDMYRVPDG